ncbi:anaerobic sulfatase-maturation protein [Desertivirga brevis]|uniref:anaerobic sulfatase-maturation protein n=1 Tax=Desertivirga brevis TaxID=2810310 RepID=UPI001A96BA19|nr:anaerobic sulfatase-maturation protein [Pedobacter sp. SYSU D00873]
MNPYPFNFIAKPAGPTCNLDCAYCYYLEKEKLFPSASTFMSDLTLENFTRQYIQEQPGNEITFVWQGGEPCLAGIDFYKKALDLQKKYAHGKIVNNSFQTNGILLNDEWCSFFSKNNFLIGISIDGPEDLHDQFRVDKGQKGTFQKVLNAIELLKKHKVEFNTLTVVNNVNVEHPLRMYNFLKDIGSTYIQFIPLVERIVENEAPEQLKLVLPECKSESRIASWSVPSLKFGRFLVDIFNEWLKRDVGTYFIQVFDATLANEAGQPAGVCLYGKDCNNALAIEHNGDVFSCDHYVYPDYKIGNVNTENVSSLLQNPDQLDFHKKKSEDLPAQCKNCRVYHYCHGECPKNRISTTRKGDLGLNYLCEGYKHFFGYVQPYMKFMANELKHKRAPANIMYVKRQVILKRFRD